MADTPATAAAVKRVRKKLSEAERQARKDAREAQRARGAERKALANQRKAEAAEKNWCCRSAGMPVKR